MSTTCTIFLMCFTGATCNKVYTGQQLCCCRKFHDKKMSQALGNARPDRLADRKALLRIDTSILANASSVLLDTAQVCIRIYRSAPSLAASMSGSLTCSKSQTSTDKQSAQPKLLWQSANLTTDAKGIIIVDIECSATATDAAFEGHSRLAKSSLMQQVLQYVQQDAGVKLATKSAKVRVVRSCICCFVAADWLQHTPQVRQLMP